MAKAKKVKDVVAAAEEAAASVEKAAAKTRGIRGLSESAEITLVAESNPKRPGSKSFERFALYQNGMTQGEALDAGVLTADLIWDSKHGFITIEGYDPGEVVKPKAREPKATKEPKAKKVKAPKAEKTEEQVQADAEAQEESMA